MTQLFSYFSRSDAPVHLPGAPFIAAATLVAGAIALYAAALGHLRRASMPPAEERQTARGS
jgi:hypothetical protein